MDPAVGVMPRDWRRTSISSSDVSAHRAGGVKLLDSLQLSDGKTNTRGRKLP